MTTDDKQKSKPAATLRDRALKCTIWKNTSDKGDFYSVELVRGYRTGDKDDKGNEIWKDTNSLSGAELLRGANLLQSAYNMILNFEAEA